MNNSIGQNGFKPTPVQASGLQKIMVAQAEKSEKVELKPVKVSLSFKDRIVRFFKGIYNFFTKSSSSTPSATPTKPAPSSGLHLPQLSIHSDKRSLDTISSKWVKPTHDLNQKLSQITLNPSISELKALSKLIVAEKVHLGSKNPETTASQNNLSLEDTQQLQRTVMDTLQQLDKLAIDVAVSIDTEIGKIARSITAPLTTLTTENSDKIDTLTFDALHQLSTSITVEAKHSDPGALSQIAKTHHLNQSEFDQLKAKVVESREVAKDLNARCIELAPARCLSEVTELSLDSLKHTGSSDIQSKLQTMGCSPKTCNDVNKSIVGLIHFADSVGAGASALGADIRSIGDYSSPQAASRTIYSELTANTKRAICDLFSKNILTTGTESTAFLRQQGFHMRFFSPTECAKDIVEGNYSALTQRDAFSMPGMDTASRSFDRINASLGMNAATTPHAKSQIAIQQSLHSTLNNLKSNVSLTGIDGKKTQLPTQSVKFDAQTVSALMTCASERDRNDFNLLFGYAMILQHKLDTGTPMTAPLPPEFTAQLGQVLGLHDPSRVTEFVDKGFANDKAAEKSMTFISNFSARLAQRSDIQGVLFEIASTPVDSIDGFVGKLYRSAANTGSIDVDNAAAIVRQYVDKFSNPTATNSTGPTDLDRAVIRSNRRSVLERIEDLPRTIGANLFDLRKGISTVDDRISKISSYTQKIQSNADVIAQCQADIATINSTIASTPPLPSGIEIQHVRRMVNADLARAELTALSNGPIARPSDSTQLVSPDHLAAKIRFTEPPTLFGTNAGYDFKHKDMTTVLRHEVTSDGTLIKLCRRETGYDGSIQETNLGYLDPTRDKSFIATYTRQASSAISLCDNSANTRNVQSQIPTSESRQKIVSGVELSQKKSVLEKTLTAETKKMANREGKNSNLFKTGSSAFKTAQNAARVAIAEFTREQLQGLSRSEMKETMQSLTESINNDPATLDRIHEKLTHFYGASQTDLRSLLQSEARTFNGEASFKEWQGDYRLSGQARIAAKITDSAESTNAAKHDKILEKSRLVISDLAPGGRIQLNFGHGLEINTGLVGRLATSAASAGAADVKLTATAEKSDGISLLKTDAGYRVELSRNALTSIGLEGVFSGIVTVGVEGNASRDVGYHLEFNSAEDAAKFTTELITGNLEGVKDRACFGAASAVSESSGKSIGLSATVAVQMAAPIPGLDSTLSLGSVKLSASGSVANDTVENAQRQTTITTLSFSGSMVVNIDAVASAAGKVVSFLSERSQPDGDGLIDKGLSSAHDEATQRAETKAESLSTSLETSLTLTSSVSVTTSRQGFIENYGVSDKVACNILNRTEMNGSNLSHLAVNTLLTGAHDSPTLEGKLDHITRNDPAIKSAVLALLSKAEPGQEIIVARQLSPDKCFELNTLLSTSGKSPDQITTDSRLATEFVKDIRNFDIHSISLVTTESSIDHGTSTTVPDGVRDRVDQSLGDLLGKVSKTTIARGSEISLETVDIHAMKQSSLELSDIPVQID